MQLGVPLSEEQRGEWAFLPTTMSKSSRNLCRCKMIIGMRQQQIRHELESYVEYSSICTYSVS
jgi:hypothetical protein